MTPLQNLKWIRQVVPIGLGIIVVLIGLLRSEAGIIALGAGLLGVPAMIPGNYPDPDPEPSPAETSTHSPGIVPGLEEQLEENDEDYIEYRD